MDSRDHENAEGAMGAIGAGGKQALKAEEMQVSDSETHNLNQFLKKRKQPERKAGGRTRKKGVDNCWEKKVISGGKERRKMIRLWVHLENVKESDRGHTRKVAQSVL